MNAQLIGELRAMLHKADLTQDEYEIICRAIRALGGNP